jgi:hypothetical protein
MEGLAEEPNTTVRIHLGEEAGDQPEQHSSLANKEGEPREYVPMFPCAHGT